MNKKTDIRFMRVFCFVIVFLLGHGLSAQNLTGIWRGKRTQVSGGCYPEYSLELHVYYVNNNQIMGNAFNFFDKEHYTKINFTGRYNPASKRLVIIENAVVEFNVPNNCIPCIKTYDLNFSEIGKPSFDGEWKGHEMGNENICPPGKIHLEKESLPVFPVDVFQNDTLAQLQKQAQFKNREKEIVQTIVIDTNEVTIELYDNAEIDGDTVTVFVNNTMLLHKKMLTDRPLKLSFTAFPNMEYEVMMYAENLGRIPPNTSLMIITAGKKRYEMRISSSESKSAVVKFKYEIKKSG
ncbi:MAG: hypothetical protein K2P88_04760 [Chitinophagaceae bacterium]|uniref:hypothetical protein n=1 Tax=unclassified Paraflavitalea TaxID=2798305 RepID=UPI003D33811C|nr:hypothetical protein [Chitinophagaceae bacterium]